MRTYLHFDAYYETEMPDINPSTLPYRTILEERIKTALDELSDKWYMEYLSIVEV